jgi:uncharacterized protein YunC (DUF1805 family)
MVKEVHKVVKEADGHRIILANSATSIDEKNKGDVVVDGSHFGLNVGQMALKADILGMIGNDAGNGLEDAGVAGLAFLGNFGVPAATVSSMSAKIGDGKSTYDEGMISVANDAAKNLGITAGMSAKEAADKMLEAATNVLKTGNQSVVASLGKYRIVIVDASSDVSENNSNDIIITGSHSGENACTYLSGLGIKGTIGNDGGLGKEDAGIAGLKVLEDQNIPAAAVAAMSAKIGNGASTYEQGRISAANKLARDIGVSIGLPAKEAAEKMLQAVSRQSR